MSFDKIQLFLNNLPLKYNGVPLKFKGLEVNKALGKDVLDIIYEYQVDNSDEPFVVYGMFDYVFEKRIRRYVQHMFKPLYASGEGEPRYWENFKGIRFCVDLKIDGRTEKVYEYGRSSSDNEIVIGNNLEKLFEESYNGNINTNYGDCFYTIKYSTGRNGRYTMVDDSSLYIRPNVYISDFTFTSDYHIDPPELTEELINSLNNITEDMVVDDIYIPVSIAGYLPYQESINVKMSDLTKGFLEMLLFYELEEGNSHERVSPPHSEVLDTMYPLLQGYDDSYVRPSMDNCFVNGSMVKPLSSYWPDDYREAERTFITSYAADYIKQSGLISNTSNDSEESSD